MDLPINEKELNTIIDVMRATANTELYQKLWTYKMNYVLKNKKVESK